MAMNALDSLRFILVALETEWGVRPIVVLACAGYSDEHWQIRHPDAEMPSFSVTPDGMIHRHPDGHPSHTVGV